jgi:hypothetical protein
MCFLVEGQQGGESRSVRGGNKSVSTHHGDRVTRLTAIF